MKTLPVLLFSSAAALALSTTAFAQTPAPMPGATPPIVAPPPGEGPNKPGTTPKGQQPPVMDPAEVPATQGDTVAPPAGSPPSVDPSAPAGPAMTPATPPVASTTPATGSTTMVSGATVKDAQGNAVGTIEKIGTGSNAGQVTLKVDGRSVTVAQSVLSETNGGVVSAQTKADLLASAEAMGKKKN